MKKLVVILFSFISFTSLKAQPNNSTVGDICVPYPVMKGIQTDLLVGDSAKAILGISNLEITQLKNKVLFHMNEADNYKAQADNLKAINENLKKQISLNDAVVNTLKSDYRVLRKAYRINRTRSTVFEILEAAGALLIAYEALRYRNLYIKHM